MYPAAVVVFDPSVNLLVHEQTANRGSSIPRYRRGAAQETRGPRVATVTAPWLTDVDTQVATSTVPIANSAAASAALTVAPTTRAAS
jgi:hypothetical protein